MQKNIKSSQTPAGLIYFYHGKSFESIESIYGLNITSAVVSFSDFKRRFRSLIARNALSEITIADALGLDVKEYRIKYGSRKTILEVNGKSLCLRSYYLENRTEKSVQYSNFRTRCIDLNKRGAITEELLRDAMGLAKLQWHTHYGGGRHGVFTYTGDLFPSLNGKQFRSISSFLEKIGRYNDRFLIWNRVKSGWDLDAALQIPAMEKGRRKGIIYKIERVKNGQVYIGLTVSSIQQRWAYHLRSASKGSKSLMANAIREDGASGFELEILEENISREKLPSRESYWMNYYDSRGVNGLNSAPPGGLGSPRGHSVTIDGQTFRSKEEAADFISKLKGIPPHVVLTRLRKGLPIPSAEKVRKHSKHPEAGSNLFRRWLGMLKRHPKSVSKSWSESYDSFKMDVSPAPENMELVRVDNKLPWGQGNTKWVSMQEKIERCHGKPVSINGIVFPTKASAAKSLGIPVSTLNYRMKKRSHKLVKGSFWAVRAITKP